MFTSACYCKTMMMNETFASSLKGYFLFYLTLSTGISLTSVSTGNVARFPPGYKNHPLSSCWIYLAPTSRRLSVLAWYGSHYRPSLSFLNLVSLSEGNWHCKHLLRTDLLFVSLLLSAAHLCPLIPVLSHFLAFSPILCWEDVFLYSSLNVDPYSFPSRATNHDYWETTLRSVVAFQASSSYGKDLLGILFPLHYYLLYATIAKFSIIKTPQSLHIDGQRPLAPSKNMPVLGFSKPAPCIIALISSYPSHSQFFHSHVRLIKHFATPLSLF